MKVVHLYRRVFRTLRFFTGRCDRISGPIFREIKNRDLELVDSRSLEFIESQFPEFPLNEELRNRFEQGSRLIGLTLNGEIVSWGWTLHKRCFWISEIGFFLKTHDACVLYDFYSKAEYQKKGLHKLLLSYAFSDAHQCESALIFTQQTNIAPLKVYSYLGLSELSPFKLLVSGRFSKSPVKD